MSSDHAPDKGLPRVYPFTLEDTVPTRAFTHSCGTPLPGSAGYLVCTLTLSVTHQDTGSYTRLTVLKTQDLTDTDTKYTLDSVCAWYTPRAMVQNAHFFGQTLKLSYSGHLLQEIVFASRFPPRRVSFQKLQFLGNTI